MDKILLIIFLLIITSGLVFLYIKSGYIKPFPKIAKDNNFYHLACPYDRVSYEIKQNNRLDKIKAKGIIIPHHLLAKDVIEKTLDLLSTDYQTIFLIGPNHRNLGKEAVQTSRANWRTQFGILSADLEAIDRLPANIYEENFDTEHSICSLVSFIKIYFPQAKIVPIILKSNTTVIQSKQLAEIVSNNCHDCLVMNSVDFSHEVSSKQAEINDQASAKILTGQQFDNLNKVTADSQPAMQTLLFFLKEQNVRKVRLVDLSDSFKISGVNPESVTSYISMIYY